MSELSEGYKRIRAMKDTCAILHQVQQTGGNVKYYGDIEGLINTVEDIYHEMKAL